MKLRLPHKFQAALMAALASVSITTLSTGSTAQASTAAELNTALGELITLNNYMAGGDYTFSYTLTTVGTSGTGTILTLASGYYFNTQQGTYGGLSTTSGGVSGGWPVPTEYSGSGLNVWETTNSQLTGWISRDKNGTGTSGNSLNGSTITVKYSKDTNTTTFELYHANKQTTDRVIMTGVALGADGLSFGNWTSAGTDLVFRAGKDYVWNGTDGNATWNAANTNWLDGGNSVAMESTGNALFTANGAVKSVTIGENVTAKNMAVQDNYTFVMGGHTVGVSVGMALASGKTLTLDGAGTLNVGANIAGGGNITKAGGGTLNLNATANLGTLTVESGNTLTVQSGTVSVTTLAGAGVLDIASDAVVANSSSTAFNGVKLSGDGTYALKSGSTTLTAGLGDNWTGIVRVSELSATNRDMSALRTSLSTLELKGFNGWMKDKWKGTLDYNIKLTNGSGGYGWQNGAFGTGTNTMEFTGKWSGEGQYLVSGSTGDRTMHYTYSGNITDWQGEFKHNGAQHTNLTFKGSATNVNIAISMGTSSSGTFTVVADAAGITFSKSVSANAMTLNSGASATLKGTTSLTTVSGAGALTVNSGSNTVAVTNLNSTGAVTVQGGTLALSGNSSAGATVKSGATLSFASTLTASGTITVEEGGILYLGNAVYNTNAVTVGTLTMQDGAKLDLSGTGITGYETDAITLLKGGTITTTEPGGWQDVEVIFNGSGKTYTLDVVENNLVLTFAQEAKELEWNGADGATWETGNNWTVKDDTETTAFQDGSKVYFTSTADSKTVTVGADVIASAMTVSGSGYSVGGSGSVTVSGNFTVEAGGSMSLANGLTVSGDLAVADGGALELSNAAVSVVGGMQVAQGGKLTLSNAGLVKPVLTQATGAGEIVINAVTELNESFTTAFTGELTIAHSRTSGDFDLKLWGGAGKTYNFSSLKAFNLEEGAAVSYWGQNSTINNLTLKGSAAFNIYATEPNNTPLSLNGTTDLNGYTLTMGNAETGWKRLVNIAALKGDASSKLVFEGGGYTDNQKSRLTINSLQEFSGTLELKENNGNNPLEATLYGGTGNAAVSFKALNMVGAGEAFFRVWENGAAHNFTVDTVTMAAGSKVTAYYATMADATYAEHHLTIGNLTLDGNATVATSNYGGLLNIGKLTSTAARTLTLQSDASSDVKNIFNLGGEGVTETTFSGTLLVNQNQNGDRRTLNLILNDEFTAANAVVQFDAVTTTNRRALAMGINADLVKIAGLKDGTMGTCADNSAYSLFSGSYDDVPYQFPKNTASSTFYDSINTKNRTLEITGGDSYSTSIRVLRNINLKMSGSGTQTFSGDVSQFDGSLETTSGTLAFANAITAAALNGTGGILQADSGLTVGGGTYAGTLTTSALTVNTGTLTFNGGTIDTATLSAGTGTLAIAPGTGATVTFNKTLTNAGNITLGGEGEIHIGNSTGFTTFKEATEYTYSGAEGTKYAGSGFITGTNAQYYLIQGNGGSLSGSIGIQGGARVTDGEGITNADYVFTVSGGEPLSTDVYYVNSDLAYDDDEMGLALKLSIKDGVTLTAAGTNLAGKELVLGQGSTWKTSSGGNFNAQQVQTLTLQGDATVTANANASIAGTSATGATSMSLNGHTLQVGGNGSHFALFNTTATGSGTIQVNNNGYLQVGHSGKTSSATMGDVVVNVASGGHFTIDNNSTVTVEGLTGAGTIQMDGGTGGTINIDADRGSYTFSGSITSTPNLTMSGYSTGTQTFNLAGNTTLGTVAVNGGTLNLSSTGTLAASAVTVGANGTLGLGSTLAVTNALTFTEGARLDLSGFRGTVSSTPVTVATAGSISGFGTGMYIAPTAPRGMQASVAQKDNDIVLTFQAKSDATMHLYILTGQSNSLGAVKDSPLNATMLAAYQSEGLLFNGNMNKDSGVRFETDPTWQIVAPQKPDGSGYNNNPCMGPEYGFSYIMETKDWGAQLLGEDGTLAVVKGSLDGGGNGYWLQDANAYQSLLGSVKESIQDAVALGYSNISLDGLMYLQGESNSANEASQAATRFTNFIGYLKSDLQSWLTENPELTGITLSFDGNTVTGEPRLGSDARQTTETQLLELATSNDMINADKNGKGHVLTNDLAVTNCDGLNVHYTGNAQLTIGARYAYAFAVQKGIDVGAVRGQDRSKTLDQAGAWWMEKLPGETEVATWDISSVSTVNDIADGKTLTVGGIKIDEVYSATATAQGQGSITINGGAISLGADGINLVGGGLTANSAVTVRATQTWQAADGLRLAVNGTTTIDDGATLTLEDGLYLTFGAITGTGNLEIGHVTFDMDLDYMMANGLGKYRTSTEEVAENGFFTGNLDLVRLTGTGSAITFTGDGSVEKNITKAGELANYTLTLTNDGKALSVSGLTPETETYYARSGQVEYTSNDTGDYGIYKASTVMLAGSVEAPATLKLASELKEGTVIVTSGIGGSISIDSGVSLAASSVNAAAAPAAITGAGEYTANTISGVTGRSFTLAEAFGANVTLASDWSGSVVLSGGDTSFSKYTGLGNYDSFYSGHEVEGVMQYSTIVFNGLNVYLDHAKNTTATINANIEMRGTEDGGTGTALLLTAGNTTTTVFTGKVSGAGNLVFDKNSGSAEAIKFTGDIAGWEGSITTGTHSNGPLNLTLGGSVTNVNAAITRPDGSNHSINVTVDATNAVSFNKAVTGVSSFTIAEGKAATLAGTDAHSISNLTVNSGSSFTVANGATATVTGAVLKNTISNDGTFTLGGTVNLDALTAQVSSESYGGAEVTTTGNGFLTAHKEVRVFNEGRVSSLTMADGAAVSYNGLTGTIHTDDGVFYTDDNPTLSTFYVRIADSAEDYSTAYDVATTSLTTVGLANATTIIMNKANASLGTLTLAVGDAGAATMKATANATIGAMNGLAAGQTLHFTGETDTPAVLTLNNDNTGRMAGNVDITGVTVKLGLYKALGAYNGRGATSGTNRTITVGEGGVLDMNGAETGGDHGYKITLDGGTLTNTGTARKWSNRQPFTNVVLASDSKAVATADFGIMASSWNPTTLDLQDHVLEVSGAGRFYLSNTTVNAGENGLGTILVKGGTVNFNGNRAEASQQGAFAGNLVMAADDNGTAGTIAGRLKLGGATKVSSTVEGDTPAVVTADIDTNGQTLRFEGARDINVAPGTATGDDYNGRAAISGNGTIEHASTGTTTISGSMANFNGNVDVEAGVLNIMNAASVAVQDVTIGANGTLGVYNGTEATPGTTNEGTLTIQGTQTLTAAGAGATLNANVVMAEGSNLDVSGTGGMGLLMGSSVTINPGNNLTVDGSADVDSYLRNYFGGDTHKLYTLFEGTAGDPLQLYIGDQKVENDITFTDWTKYDMDASTIYTNLQAQTYYLVYDGSNVGMVAIGLIPEPTTSTLSLLALCALAARRRRK